MQNNILLVYTVSSYLSILTFLLWNAMIYKHIIAVTTGNVSIKVMAFSGKYFVTKLQGKENRCITKSMEVNLCLFWDIIPTIV